MGVTLPTSIMDLDRWGSIHVVLWSGSLSWTPLTLPTALVLSVTHPSIEAERCLLFKWVRDTDFIEEMKKQKGPLFVGVSTIARQKLCRSSYGDPPPDRDLTSGKWRHFGSCLCWTVPGDKISICTVYTYVIERPLGSTLWTEVRNTPQRSPPHTYVRHPSSIYSM